MEQNYHRLTFADRSPSSRPRIPSIFFVRSDRVPNFMFFWYNDGMDLLQWFVKLVRSVCFIIWTVLGAQCLDSIQIFFVGFLSCIQVYVFLLQWYKSATTVWRINQNGLVWEFWTVFGSECRSRIIIIWFTNLRLQSLVFRVSFQQTCKHPRWTHRGNGNHFRWRILEETSVLSVHYYADRLIRIRLNIGFVSRRQVTFLILVKIRRCFP